MRRIKSVLGAAVGLLVLAGGLAIVDDRVRYSFMRLAEGSPPTGELADAGHGLQDMAVLVLQAIRDQSIEHAPLTLFAIAAMVLVFFMTRT